MTMRSPSTPRPMKASTCSQNGTWRPVENRIADARKTTIAPSQSSWKVSRSRASCRYVMRGLPWRALSLAARIIPATSPAIRRRAPTSNTTSARIAAASTAALITHAISDCGASPLAGPLALPSRRHPDRVDAARDPSHARHDKRHAREPNNDSQEIRQNPGGAPKPRGPHRKNRHIPIDRRFFRTARELHKHPRAISAPYARSKCSRRRIPSTRDRTPGHTVTSAVESEPAPCRSSPVALLRWAGTRPPPTSGSATTSCPPRFSSGSGTRTAA